MSSSQMLPRRPYLLRAMFDWLVDSQLTPHLVVETSRPGVRVPMQFVRDNQIVLNIAPHSVGDFDLNKDEVRFNARFSGVLQQVIIPMAAIMAIYARENGAGMMFEPESQYDEPLAINNEQQSVASEPTSSEDDDKTPPPRGRPVFKVVK